MAWRFPGSGGGELGKSTVAKALARADVGATAHGFRSSFKDWARHEGLDELLSELALAHVEGSRTVAAYARDDLLDKRRPVMQAWCGFVAPGPPPNDRQKVQQYQPADSHWISHVVHARQTD